MKDINDYIAELKNVKNLPSDYALAKFLNLSKQAVSKWKNENVVLDVSTAWRIAEALDVEPSEIIAAAEFARAKRKNDTSKMRLWSVRLKNILASATLVVVMFLSFSPAPSLADSAAATPLLYIMLNYRLSDIS